MILSNVLFPQPLSPIIAMFSPLEIDKLIFLITDDEEYEKETLCRFNIISFLINKLQI